MRNAPIVNGNNLSVINKDFIRAVTYNLHCSRLLPTKTVKLFADDTNIFIFHQDISMINTMANEYMSLLSQWFVANKLSLNIDATCFITFANKKVENPDK